MKDRYITILYMILLPLFMCAQQIIDVPQLNKLPIQSIHRIFQDKEGYIWYGTSDGLCRDDGYNVQIFRSDLHTPNRMQSNLILTIAEDTHRQIWVGTDKGVYILDKSAFTIRQLDTPNVKDEKIILIHATSDGSMWVGVSGGLYQYAPNGTLQASYPIRGVEYFYEDREHNLWVCVSGEGLCKLNKDTKTIENFSSGKGVLENSIIQDRNQNIYWVGTWGDGIARFNPKAPKGAMYTYQPATSTMDGRILYLTQDDVYGAIWTTTYSGIMAFKVTGQNRLEPVNTSGYLPQDNKMLSEIIKDKDKNLWVAAFDRKSFMINLKDNTVNEYRMSVLQQRINGNPAIVSLCKDEDNVFWVSQARYGLCLYCPDSDVLIHYNDCAGTKDQPLWAVAYLIKSNEKGKIWAMSEGTSVYGIRQAHLSMNMEETIDLKTITQTPGTLKTIYEDKSGNLWMGTTTGLYVYRAESKSIETIRNVIGIVSGITETNDGAIWVCVSNKGVYKIGQQANDFYPNNQNLSCIDATSDGKLWIGTYSGGILLLDSQNGGTYTDYSQTCNMNGDVLEKVLVDAFNHVWILTNQNVKEFNPKNNVYHNYSAPGKSFLLNRFLPLAAYKHTDNTLFFGGIPGFISIKAGNRLESIAKPIKTFITDIKVGDESLFFNQHRTLADSACLDIPSDSYNIEISFSTLNYWDTSQIRYAYRLIGVDKDWVYAVNGKNTAFYNRLDKGKYTFQVKATDEYGLWSNHITAFTINKLPAWYETGWAYLFYSLFLISLVWTVIYLYLQKVKQKNYEIMVEQLAEMKLRLNQQKQNVPQADSKLEIAPLEFSSLDEQLITKALQVIEENLDDFNFGVSQLADQLNVSRGTLSRKIKAIAGQTPLEFIRSIKMKHACRMLQNPNMTVSEVVVSLGYSDHKYFTTTFKDTFGMTPSEYQKKNKSPQ